MQIGLHIFVFIILHEQLVFFLIEESVIIFCINVLIVIFEQDAPYHGDQVRYHPNMKSKFNHIVKTRNPQLAYDLIIVVDLVICTSWILHGFFNSTVKVVPNYRHNSFIVYELEQLRKSLALNQGYDF